MSTPYMILASVMLTGATTTPAQSPQPRLYIHAKSVGQLPQAKALQTAMTGSKLGSVAIQAIPPDIQAASQVKVTELRCTSIADCRRVDEMAALVRGVLDGPVNIRDMGARYDKSSANRPLHFEVWFGDDPIRIKSTSGAEVAEQSGPQVRWPQTIYVVRPKRASPGDTVHIVFTSRPLPAGAAITASVGGQQAAVAETERGFDLVIPKVSQNLFSTRTLPVSFELDNRWHFRPAVQVAISSKLRQVLPLLAGVAIFAVLLIGSLYLFIRRRDAHRAADIVAMVETPYAQARRSVYYEPAARSDVTLKVPDDLVEACLHGNQLLYVGGAINSADGYPSHADVLDEIVSGLGDASEAELAEIQALLSRGDFDTVSDVLSRRIGRTELVTALAGHYKDFAPYSLQDLLATNAFSGIVNTSFSPVADLVAPSVRRIDPASEYDFIDLVKDSHPFLLNMGGDLRSSRSVYLTNFEIAGAVEGTPNLRQALNALFVSRPILFVGVSPKTLATAFEIIGSRSASSQRHYALIQDEPGFELAADRFREQYGIHFLKIGAAGDIPAFAQALAERIMARGSEPERQGAQSTSPKITSIRLQNIGPFREQQIDFRKAWSVLLGNNGAGKSTVLRAIAFALCGDDPLVRDYAKSLLRRNERSGAIEVTLDTMPSPTTYRTELTLGSGDRVAIRASVAPLQAGTIQVYGYPAVRGAPQPGILDQGTDGNPRPDPADVLPIISGIDTRSKGLRQWIMRCYGRSNDPHLDEDQRSSNRGMIDSLFSLIDKMAPGFTVKFSRVDTLTSEVLIYTSDGEVPLDYLSQGLSSTLGWAGPLIQRLYEVNGSLSKPEDQHATLLIDEIDGHLHPEWQQKLVTSLKDRFPSLQVIATTHSPLMVGSLAENEVMRVTRSPEGVLGIDYMEQSFIGYRFDQILTDEAFGLDRARSEAWTARDEYLKLMAKAKRTVAEEQRIETLRAELQGLPAPFETPAEWKAARENERELDDMLARVEAQFAKTVASKNEGATQ